MKLKKNCIYIGKTEKRGTFSPYFYLHDTFTKVS